MPIRLSPLVHIEIAVHDAEAAADFLHTVFGAERVQREFAAFLDNPFAKAVHVALGNVILQFVEPQLDPAKWGAEEQPEGVRVGNVTFFVKDLPNAASWHDQLREKGPGVHNLTFLVDDVEEAVRRLSEAGVEPKCSFQLDWAKLLGSQSVKPNPAPAYMVDCMQKVGFNLELAENPAKEDINFLG